MFSQDAKSFMEFCALSYKQTGKSEFNFTDYMQLPNYEAAISELIDKGILEKQNNILATVSINFEVLKS